MHSFQNFTIFTPKKSVVIFHHSPKEHPVQNSNLAKEDTKHTPYNSTLLIVIFYVFFVFFYVFVCLQNLEPVQCQSIFICTFLLMLTLIIILLHVIYYTFEMIVLWVLFGIRFIYLNPQIKYVIKYETDVGVDI